MMTGKIRSFGETKGYGFIQGEDGESYFFHKNEVKDPGAGIKANKLVVFDTKPTPKGMAACLVSVTEPAGYIYKRPETTDVIFSKTMQCGRDNQVMYSGQAFTCEDRSPDVARKALIKAASDHGFNAVLNVDRSQRTHSGFFDGNYKYTVHAFTGTPALVRKPLPSMSPADVQESDSELQAKIEGLRSSGIESQLYGNSELNPLALLLLAAVVIALIMFSSL